MKPLTPLIIVIVLLLPAGVFAESGYGPGMMDNYAQNGTVQYGPGVMGNYSQNYTGPYGPAVVGNCWQNGTGSYGMMTRNGPGYNIYGRQSGLQYGMMNGWGYGNTGGILPSVMLLAGLLCILFVLVWTIAGILLSIWLYRKISAK